jgi:hypothetical protein
VSSSTAYRPLSLATIFGAPLALVVAGHVLVLQRTTHPTEGYLAIRGDSNAYIEMVEGHWRTMRVPFRYRIFVPWLAHLLPMSPVNALRLITYVGLYGFYVIVLATCRTLALGQIASLVGLFSVFTAWWHLYQYNNPFLIDGFVLFILSATVFALLHDKFGWFVVLLMVGLLARETFIVIAPAWFLLRSRRRGTFAAACALAALVAPRLVLSGSATSAATGSMKLFEANNPLHRPLTYLVAVFAAWGFLWLLLPVGALLWPPHHARTLQICLALVLTGAIASSLIASDTGRLFAPMSLFVACACAQVVQRLLDVGDSWKFWIAPLVAVSFAQAVVSVIPMVWIDEHRSLLRTGADRTVMFALSGTYAAVVARHFRHELASSARQIKSTLRLKFERRGGARA